MVQEMTVEQFLARRLSGKPIALIDVREDWEIELAAAPCEHVHIPMGQIPARMAELDPPSIPSCFVTPAVEVCKSPATSRRRGSNRCTT